MRLTRRSAIQTLAGASILRPNAKAAAQWISMFDGKSLKGWKETPFTGRGQVRIENGTIQLGRGRMTGITWTGQFPRSGYEIRFEGARLDGNDFFASIVFPVNDAYCSWINGGWDGTVVGLSSLEGNDASENDTSTIRDFAQGRWYRFRLAFEANRIQAWIDDVIAINVDVAGRQVGLRFDDTDLCAPLGFVSYNTTCGLRNLEFTQKKG